MMTHPKKPIAEYKNVSVLVTNQVINSMTDIVGVMDALSKSGQNSLIIIAEKVSQEVLGTLITNKMKGIFNTLVVEAPGYYDKKEQLEDIATVTDATLIDLKVDMKLKNVELGQLGSIESIESTADKTTIINNIDIEDKIQAMRDDYDSSGDERLLERIAKLDNGIAVIKVGAPTKDDRDYLYKKMDNAVNATKHALQGGVVQGGSLSFVNVADDMDDNILTEALRAPHKKLQENAHGELKVADDIIDPLKVVVTALEKACSTVSIFLTTDIVIANKKEDTHEQRVG